jgi:hypothetical protein
MSSTSPCSHAGGRHEHSDQPLRQGHQHGSVGGRLARLACALRHRPRCLPRMSPPAVSQADSPVRCLFLADTPSTSATNPATSTSRTPRYTPPMPAPTCRPGSPWPAPPRCPSCARSLSSSSCARKSPAAGKLLHISLCGATAALSPSSCSPAYHCKPKLCGGQAEGRRTSSTAHSDSAPCLPSAAATHRRPNRQARPRSTRRCVSGRRLLGELIARCYLKLGSTPSPKY